ncbi:acyltransferase [Streptomyces sp. SID13726]|uniref:acyltransferase n=1 Tax=Streptomyces sp. SID13726 TaxID=2706058 RepID=UPI0013BA467F|nr:acyltransferase [Streptomyces sp. SID13726]NEA99366.1 acyltransferase [Streptomyces sp. SID13726]
MDLPGQPSVRHFDHCPWLFTGQATEEQRLAQREVQRAVVGDTGFGERCYVAESAAVFPDRLRLGNDSYIAAHAYVTGDLTTGTDCTLNPFTTVRGTVALGNGVRIGAHTSLLGFNHTISPDLPVFRQPLTSRGIRIGDDVWIGSNVVVVDGVTVGDHCVIGAGAVVTKDLPAWSVAAGNPARVLRDRREQRGRRGEGVDSGTGAVISDPGMSGAPAHTGPAGVISAPGTSEATPGSGDTAPEHRTDHAAPNSRPSTATSPDGARRHPLDLAGFADTARSQVAPLLERCWDGERYVDRPGAAPTVRAHCDAVEIADLLLSAVPEQLSAEEHVGRLSRLQDPKSGLVPEFGEPLPEAEADGFIGDGAALYHVLCVGYALDVLGSGLPHPVRGVQDMTARQLTTRLEALPWRTGAWGAGAWIDSWATAAHWNLRHGEPGNATTESLFGWLLTRADPWTGMWGTPSAEAGRLQVVNGYYRLTRGSFAQFGLPVPYPERVVDAVLDHSRDTRYFGASRENACNVLDVAHPLWLSTRQLNGYRTPEIQHWAEHQLTALLPRWHPSHGFAFGPGPGPEPGLQGTEMWLAITWYLADLLGRSDELGYHPRGIHRPEPARQGVRRLN